jgi:hypothetical protein
MYSYPACGRVFLAYQASEWDRDSKEGGEVVEPQGAKTFNKFLLLCFFYQQNPLYLSFEYLNRNLSSF